MTTLAQRSFRARPLNEPLAVAAIIALAALLAVAASLWPLYTLIGCAAVVVAGVCLVKVEVAVLALVASGPLELALSYGANSQITPTKAVGAVAFVSFALNALVTRRRLVFDWAHAIVLAILAVAMVSTIHAHQTGDAISTTSRYASFVALFFVVSQFVGDHRLQRLIAWTLTIASAVTGFLAVREFLSGASLLARLPQGDPNDVAFVLATTLPLSFWLLRERGFRRVLAVALIGMISVAILLTFSRGALVGLGAGLVWKILVDRRNVGVIAAGVVTIGAAVALVVFLAGGRIDTGLHAKKHIAGKNVSTRLQAWGIAANFAVDHPLLGIGPGQFRDRYNEAAGQLPGADPLKVVHNAYLDVAGELGVVAGLLFVSYLGLVITRAWTANVTGRGPPGYGSVLTIALLVGCVSALTLSEQYYAPFWLLGALATALWHEGRGSESATA